MNKKAAYSVDQQQRKGSGTSNETKKSSNERNLFRNPFTKKTDEPVNTQTASSSPPNLHSTILSAGSALYEEINIHNDLKRQLTGDSLKQQNSHELDDMTNLKNRNGRFDVQKVGETQITISFVDDDGGGGGGGGGLHHHHDGEDDGPHDMDNHINNMFGSTETLNKACYYTVTGSNDKDLFFSRHLKDAFGGVVNMDTVDQRASTPKPNGYNDIKKENDLVRRKSLLPTLTKASGTKPQPPIQPPIQPPQQQTQRVVNTKLEPVSRNKDSIVTGSAVHQNNHNPTSMKTHVSLSDLDIKRRTIAEVIGNLGGDKNYYHQRHGNSSNSNSSNSGDKKIQMKLDNQRKASLHKHHGGKSHSFTNGLSIIYGIFLFIVGAFLSLDIYAGQMGDQRLFSAIFFFLLFGISIGWLVFLYIDVHKYSNELQKEIQSKQNPETHKTSTEEIYLEWLDTPQPNMAAPRPKSIASQYQDLPGDVGYVHLRDCIENIYEVNPRLAEITAVKSTNIRQSANRNKIDARRKPGSSGGLKTIDEAFHLSGLNDQSQKYYDNLPTYVPPAYMKAKFEGYLNDKNAPFNLYLKAGVGIFWIVTVFQCIIDIVESFETKFKCEVENFEAIIALFQVIFVCFQFLFLFTRSNLVICRHEGIASFFSMHLTMTNLIIWFKYILLETMNEFYDEQLIEYFDHSKPTDKNVTLPKNMVKFSSNNESANSSTTMLTTIVTTIAAITKEPFDVPSDCYKTDSAVLQNFVITIKPFIYPFTIEFSVICATLFFIMWSRIGTFRDKHRTLLALKTKFTVTQHDEYIPNPNMLIMLDCTKTSKGLFCGILILVGTIVSAVMFLVFNGSQDRKTQAALISQITELVLLFLALIITILAYIQVQRYYTKVQPQMNLFDVVLEVFSMNGVYAFGINSLIAIFYTYTSQEDHSNDESHHYSTSTSSKEADELVKIITAAVAFVSMVQATLQTFFILECLRRYAKNKRELMRKPGRELITALLLTNISLWIYDTLSGKKFDANKFLIGHFGILKWSIINAFSSPLAIFYRFHSSVCLSDIWYGLFYGEIDDEDESGDEMENDMLKAI